MQGSLQIRVVPYSPPRLSSDFSVTSNLERDACSPLSATSPANVEVYSSDTPQYPQPADSSPVACSPVSPLGPYSRTPNQDGNRTRASTPRRPSTSSSTNRRLKHVVNVHADKTFSLQPQVEYESSSVYSSSFLNSTVTNSTYGRNSSVTFSYGRRSSILPTQQEDSAPTSPEDYKPSPAPIATQTNAASTSSPWNYEFVGGVRKVFRETPESEFQEGFSPITSPTRAYAPPSNLGSSLSPANSMIIPRKPLPRSYTESPGESSLANFTIVKQAQPSPLALGQQRLEYDNFTPLSTQNYRILGDSGSSDYSLGSQSRPRTEDSEPNVVKHDGLPSPSVGGTPHTRLKSEFSRESMVVAPLNTARKLFADKPISVKLPQGGSSPRFLAAWSAMMNQDAARALFGSRIYPPRRNSRTPSQGESSASATPRTHQFQGQPPLSTVFSESEANSERLSRSMSPAAAEASTSRLSPDLYGDDLEAGEYSFTRQVTPTSEPVDWPQAAYGKGTGRETYRLVGDQDEHGDGLTDLRDLLQPRPSRRGGIPAMMSSYASDRNLWSSASARATNWAIPAWARLYYGGGERRFLAHQGSRDSIRSNYTDSQSGSSLPRRSPSIERFGPFSQRQHGGPSTSSEIQPAVTVKRSYPDMNWARTLKKQTSSLWSPHLRRDKRASRYDIWDPPSGALSVEGCITARRNVQVVLFMSGFLLPVAWMVAAFLPLPTNRGLVEKEFGSTSHIDLTEDDGASPTQLAREIALYNRAKWWRDLNRAMAVIGLLIIGAFAVLIALGVQQRWG